jgi:hypothetical protein
MRNDLDSSDRMFDFECLVADLHSNDEQIKEAAMFAAYRLKQLAQLRATTDGTSPEESWTNAFDLRRLWSDVDGTDPQRRLAALNVIDELVHLDALRAMKGSPPLMTAEEDRWARSMVAQIRERLNQLRTNIRRSKRASASN